MSETLYFPADTQAIKSANRMDSPITSRGETFRPLVDDDPQQTARVRELVEECARRDELLFVPLTVSLELEWVLRARYSFTRDEVLAALVGLLESREFEFQDEPSVEHALHLYRSTNADFAECLHLAAAIAHNRTPLLTFDRTASRLEGAQVIL